MRKLLLSSALAGLAATAAMAQTDTTTGTTTGTGAAITDGTVTGTESGTGTTVTTTQDGSGATSGTMADSGTGLDTGTTAGMGMHSDGLFRSGSGEMALRASDFIGKSVYVTGQAGGAMMDDGAMMQPGTGTMAPAAGTTATTGAGTGTVVDPTTGTVTTPETGSGMAAGTGGMGAAPGNRWTADRLYADESMMGLRDGWENIGDVNDVILSGEGEVEAVLIDVGGFLGIGERTVAVSMDQLRFAPADGMAMPMAGDATDGTVADLSDFILVVNVDRATLESAPEYEGERVAPGMAPRWDDQAAMTGTRDTMMTTDRTAGTSGLIEREGFMAAETGYMTAENMTGAPVYDANDEEIGNIGELILDEGGQVTQAVVDIGGFLGIGVNPVAIPLDQMQFLRAQDGDELRVYVSMTEDQMEALPAYEN